MADDAFKSEGYMETRDPYGEGKKTIQLMGQDIVGRKIDSGTRGIRGFQLADGTMVDYQQALDAIHNGQSRGLIATNARFGVQIRTSPDGYESNNLDDLPIVND